MRLLRPRLDDVHAQPGEVARDVELLLGLSQRPGRIHILREIIEVEAPQNFGTEKKTKSQVGAEKPPALKKTPRRAFVPSVISTSEVARNTKKKNQLHREEL